MRPPHRSTRGRRNDNPDRDLSPPSDSSATTETDEQRARRVYDENLKIQVQAFSENHQVCRRVPLFFTPSGQPRPVEEVAKKLVGQYLINRQSNLVIRIVETEAYREHEQIYRYRFPEPPLDFRSPAGSLVSYTIAFGQKFTFITAGADDSGDLVLLRTCCVNYGYSEIASRMTPVPPNTEYDKVNIMSGPTKVAMALESEIGDYCYLLSPSRGLYLVYHGNRNPLIMLEGPRLLPRDSKYGTKYSEMPGANNRFRFAFDYHQTFLSRYRLRPVANQP